MVIAWYFIENEIIGDYKFHCERFDQETTSEITVSFRINVIAWIQQNVQDVLLLFIILFWIIWYFYNDNINQFNYILNMYFK